MRRLLLVFLGVLLTGVGLMVCLVPLPLPPVGITSLLGGLTLLTAHSRRARRGFQRARHRSALLSRSVEHLARRAPAGVRRILSRTRPEALVRYVKMAEARA